MTEILIVDDDWLTRVEVGDMLVSLGYDVAGKAENGSEAVDMARHLEPDLILMDVVLPGEMNGIEAASKIKTELDIPIVFISGYGDSAYVEQAKKIDPYGYVMKPFYENEVRAFVEIALHKQQVDLQLKAANQQLRQVSREWEGIFQAIGQPALMLDPARRILHARSHLDAGA